MGISAGAQVSGRGHCTSEGVGSSTLPTCCAGYRPILDGMKSFCDVTDIEDLSAKVGGWVLTQCTIVSMVTSGLFLAAWSTSWVL